MEAFLSEFATRISLTGVVVAGHVSDVMDDRVCMCLA